MDHVIEVSVFWRRVWARRRLIILMVAGSALVAGGIAFVLPPWYRAQASLLPPSEEDSGIGLSTLLRGIGVPGVRVPTETSPADVMLAVIQSRRVGEEMVQRFQLQSRYHVRWMDVALRELRRHSRFELTEAGTVVVSVEDHDPGRAAEMANAYVQLLDRFNREVRMTKGRRTRLFVEQRLSETKTSLAAAEQKLAEYQSQHKAIVLTPEMSSALDAASRRYAERAALEVRLGVVRSYTRETTDEEVRLTQELNELDRQLATLPTTSLELARLVRDVKTLEQLYTLLTAQYEEAQITEARDVQTIEVLDVATPPERRSRPQRVVIVLAAAAFALIAGVAYALMQDDEADRRMALVTGTD